MDADRSPLGRIALVAGPEEFLNERAVRATRDAVRRAHPDAETSDTVGDQLTQAALGDLTAPSLFATTRCVVVRRLEDLPDEAHDGLLSYAAEPDPDIALVLVHSGGQKGSGLLARLRKLPTVSERRSEPVRAHALAQFAQSEALAQGGRMDPAAADLLVQAVGTDLRALAAAAEQLTHDFPGQAVTPEIVGRYFSGRAEVKGYEIADHALAGRTAVALEELRWALQTGVSGPAITGSFAASLRSLARYVAARRGMREADLAREVGVPPWKLRSLRAQSRGWEEGGLATALQAVATADAAVKGAGADAAYSLERMVLAVTASRVVR